MKSDAEYKELSIREFTKAAEVYDSDHAGIYEMCKNTNATFKWGTDSGEEFVELEPRLQLVSEQSYNVEMRKHTLRGKLFAATLGKNVNNRLAIFSW